VTTCRTLALRQVNTRAVPDRASADQESEQWVFRGPDLESGDVLATRLAGLSVRSWLLDRHSDIGMAFALAGQVDGLARTAQDPRDQSDAAAAFASAITSLREPSAPYHLALGLLAYAEYLARCSDTDGAVAAVEEARGIAERLRCQPPLGRPADLTPAQSRWQA
jgi:hypothetical protein